MVSCSNNSVFTLTSPKIANHLWTVPRRLCSNFYDNKSCGIKPKFPLLQALTYFSFGQCIKMAEPKLVQVNIILYVILQKKKHFSLLDNEDLDKLGMRNLVLLLVCVGVRCVCKDFCPLLSSS